MKRLSISLGIACAVAVGVVAQQPANIGFKPLTLSEPSYSFDTAEQAKIRVTPIVRGLSHPFSLAFLPNGDALVAIRASQLRIIRNATGQGGKAPVLDPEPVAGIAQITPPLRNGGLHEVALHPKFAENRFVYFTYNKLGPTEPDPDPKRPPRRLTAITVARGRFDGKALTDVKELFAGEWEAPSGSRMAFAPDGTLYLTTGAPFNDKAQLLDNVYGKVLRLKDDGTAPADNPFVGKPKVRPEVYSYGHRDQLGLTVHPAAPAAITAGRSTATDGITTAPSSSRARRRPTSKRPR
jgi:glucose/arabinose dehydrogenase